MPSPSEEALCSRPPANVVSPAMVQSETCLMLGVADAESFGESSVFPAPAKCLESCHCAKRNMFDFRRRRCRVLRRKLCVPAPAKCRESCILHKAILGVAESFGRGSSVFPALGKCYLSCQSAKRNMFWEFAKIRGLNMVGSFLSQPQNQVPVILENSEVVKEPLGHV